MLNSKALALLVFIDIIGKILKHFLLLSGSYSQLWLNLVRELFWAMLLIGIFGVFVFMLLISSLCFQENQEIAQATLSILNDNQKTALETELSKPAKSQ